MSPAMNNALAAYRSELLRWNSVTNLVSRQETDDRVDILLAQCRDACEMLLDHAGPLALPAGPDLLYLDVGSGGGLPGFVWNLVLAGRGYGPRTWLVEPREKRAWFLRRVAAMGEPEVGVLEGRWGEVAPPESMAPQRVLVSFKALHMPDPVVLAGLEPFLANSPVDLTIARFCPADQEWDGEIRGKLEIPGDGEAVTWSRFQGTHPSGGVLASRNPGPEDAGLIISRYLLQSS